MTRLVGDARGYEFYLRQANGRYNQDAKIVLPSVTTVLDTVYSSPALQGWNYRHTRDVIAGAISLLESEWQAYAGTDAWTPDDLLENLFDTFGDGDNLEEYLKENRLRPADYAKEAAERGQREHEYLGALAEACLQSGPDDARKLAIKYLENPQSSGYARAVAGWWLDDEPVPVVSEEVVFALDPHGGFAGQLDLVLEVEGRGFEVVDLKTRKAGAEAYDKDKIQVAAYADALEKMGYGLVVAKTVLVAREDGTWGLYESTYEASTWYNMLALYRDLGGGQSG